MDFTVRTGETKGVSGVMLMATTLSSEHGEKAVLLLHGEAERGDAKTLQEECAAILQQSLLGIEGEAWTRIDGVLKELNGLLKGFLASGTLGEVHAVVALVSPDGALHVSPAGRGEVYLVRGGAASQITEYSKGKPISAFVHISSGTLEPGDAVIFSTQRLLRAFTPAQLASKAQSGPRAIDDVIETLESEKESAAVATVHVPGVSASSTGAEEQEPEPRRGRAALPSRRAGRTAAGTFTSMMQMAKAKVVPLMQSAGKAGASMSRKGMTKVLKGSSGVKAIKDRGASLLSDLKDPRRKRRAHLFLLAAAVAAFLVVWLVVRLSTTSQRSKTRAELSQLMEQIGEELQTADNRRLTGDVDGANAILQRAEERAKQVMDNESGLFRVEALDLLDRIRGKREEINNILRVPARVLVNLSSQDAKLTAQGIIGLDDGEFLVYDRNSVFRVLLNRLDEPRRITDDDVILQGTDFPRYQSQIFMTSGNSLIELNGGSELITMKTEDPAGWITGKDIETYLRYLYVLVPDRKQIYKYERLSNRYGTPVQYNVNGDLTGSIDMAIDSSVFILKENGTVVKLLRGEAQPFAIRHAPEEVLKSATKVYKAPDGGNIYFLDPARNRVIVTTDGGASGESSYLRQYILEGEQIGTMQDLYVDREQTHLYVMDEKRVYVVDLVTK